jgi:hypothetical protein
MTRAHQACVRIDHSQSPDRLLRVLDSRTACTFSDDMCVHAVWRVAARPDCILVTCVTSWLCGTPMILMNPYRKREPALEDNSITF